MTLAGKDEANLTKSFAGLRVLDFSTTIAGPHCTRMLADMGAEVIKIESSEGETMRNRPPVRNGCSTAFGQLNIGKKSLVLDLKSPDAVEIIHRLVADTDILVENFRPGVMQRLKLDYGSLREFNGKLIYCSISGYGQTGPSAELPAYAPVIHAASGYDMAHLAYQPGRSRPDYCGIYLADVLTGVYAFGAISAALHQRHSTQQGQHIDVSMLESMLSLTLNELQWSQFEVKQTPRPLFGPLETADGYVMLAVASEKTFQSLIGVIGRPEWIGGFDGRCRDMVAHSRHAEMSHRLECRWSSLFGLPHSRRSLERSANRPSERIVRGQGWRRHVQGAELAVSHVWSQCLSRKEDGNPGRAHRCLAGGSRTFPTGNRRLRRQTASFGAAVKSSAS